MRWSILSLDVSAASTGWCIMTADYGCYGVIKTKASDPRSERLLDFRKQLIEVITTHKPTHIVIEDVYSGLNAKTLKILAEFAGVAKETCQEFSKVEPHVISTNTVKSYFKVKDKESLYNFVVDVLGFAEDKDWSFKKDNDVVDAIAMAICYLDSVLNVKKFRTKTDYGYVYNHEW